MLLKKGLDKPSQLQPREQTQMGRLVLIRTSRYRYTIAEAALERYCSRAFQSSCDGSGQLRSKLQYVIQIKSARREEII